MKHILRIALGLIACMAITAACDDDDDKGFNGLAVDKEDITIGAEGGTGELVVTSGSDWVANASEPWLTISPANGLGGTTECKIAVDSTMSNEMRTAEVRFVQKGQTARTMTIRQTGYGKMISIEEPEIEIEASAVADKRYFETTVTTNVAFKIEAEYEDSEIGWITPPANPTVDLDRGYRPRTVKIRFDWKMNPDFDQRIAKIHFIPQNAEDELEVPAVLTVTQKASPKIEDNRSGDSIALLTIKERLGAASTWDPSENMRNWDNVVLWERTDEELPSEDAVGRVRSVAFYFFETDETISQEVHYLTYVESLSFSSNTNTMWRNIDLGNDICELKYLKSLTVSAYGLVSLPDDLVKLGDTLEELYLGANNFADVPDILTEENFPKLKSLSFVANRRWETADLRQADDPKFADGIGFHFNVQENDALRRLLLWENLEELTLSNNYMEGQIPDFTVEEVGSYTEEDLVALGDTVRWLYATPEGQNIPRVLPKAKKLSLNLNFFTGLLPDWILYHPYLIEWIPDILIFNQQEKGFDSNGKAVGFTNVPKTFDYYYEKYPGYREKYEFKEEITE